MKNKILYSNEIIKLVVDIYGKNSQIFQLLIGGERISDFVKASIKIKGKGVSFKIKDKKRLLQMVKQEELLMTASNDLNIVL